MPAENYVDRILKSKVYDVAVETPLEARHSCRAA